MENFKSLAIEEGRLLLYNICKLLLIVLEEIVSFFTRLPKILTLSTCLIGTISSFNFISKGYTSQGVKLFLLTAVCSVVLYFLLTLLFQPFGKLIFNWLESLRNAHHNINCGIYVGSYKINITKENSISNMLSFKELLETNILLSGLKLKTKLLTDDSNIIDYKNLLSSGLSVGNALCFSSSAMVDNLSIESTKEFVIDNDAFIKDFKEFCEKEPNDINEQIKFLKENKKKIKTSIIRGEGIETF